MKKNGKELLRKHTFPGSSNKTLVNAEALPRKWYPIVIKFAKSTKNNVCSDEETGRFDVISTQPPHRRAVASDSSQTIRKSRRFSLSARPTDGSSGCRRRGNTPETNPENGISLTQHSSRYVRRLTRFFREGIPWSDVRDISRMKNPYSRMRVSSHLHLITLPFPKTLDTDNVMDRARTSRARQAYTGGLVWKLAWICLRERW